MKFTFLSPRYHSNQVHWVSALQERNHKVDFNVLFRGYTEDYGLLEPRVFSPCSISLLIMKLIGEGGTNMPRGFPNPWLYFKALRESKTDVLIVRDIGRWFSLLGAVSARLLGIKIIIYSQTLFYKSYSTKRWIAMTLILKFFDAKWITPVLGEKSTAKNMPKDIFFVPFAVEQNIRKSNVEHKAIKILSIGKFVKRKNHLKLLKVIKDLTDDFDNFTLSIIGEVSSDEHKKYLDSCKKYIKENHLESYVKIQTNIPYKIIKEYYLDSDFFVLSASGEPAAISPLEALGCGIPAICSDTNGTKNYIRNNKTGLIFKDGSEESLMKSIAYLLDKKNLENMKKNVLTLRHKAISKENFYNSLMRLVT